MQDFARREPGSYRTPDVRFKAEILQMVKRLDPTFDFTEHGHSTFSGLLRSIEALKEVRKGANDQQVRLRQACSGK